MIILYVWALITIPMDKPICDFWISKPITMDEWYGVCPFLKRADHVMDYLRLDYINIQSGSIACYQTIKDLPDLTCHVYPLDNYKLRVVWHNSQSIACGFTIDHDGDPTTDELINNCSMDLMKQFKTGQLLLRYYGVKLPTIPPPHVIILPPDIGPLDLVNINTHNDYQILANHLNWYGIQDPDNLWQNRWDPIILKVSRQTNVPPMILKSIIGIESQYWPLWSGSQEVGLIQLTDRGADTVMRWNETLFNEFCPRAIFFSKCIYGYSVLSDQDQAMVRDLFRASLVLTGSPLQAADKISGDLQIYAEILVSYYEASAEAVAPIAPSWDYAIAAYHSGMECIRSGDICPDGKVYLDKINK